MNIQNRLLRIIYSREKNALFASDIRGRVHKFDTHLNLLQSSPVTNYDRPANSICLSNKYIFTKDRFGSIGKWDIDTLQPIDFYDGKFICDRSKLDADEEPSPTPNRGITLFKNHLYTNNGYNQIVVLDQETFDIVDITDSPSNTFFDCFCAEHDQVHAMSDVDGNIFIGNLETMQFPIQQKVDTMVVHTILYDKRHHRFWTTQDGGLGDKRFCQTGITTIDIDGQNLKVFTTSNEDNEFMQFTEDYHYLITGGFNGKVFVFDNTTKDFNLKKVFGPLEFQIIHGTVVSEEQIYVLLQTGDIIRLNGNGEEVCRANFINKCIWTFEPHPLQNNLIYAGTDYGVAIFSYGTAKFGSVFIQQSQRHAHGFGIVKDVKPLPDDSYIFIARKGYVVKADRTGQILWSKQVLGVPKGVALNHAYSKCMISTEEGMIWEFNIETGSILNAFQNGSPSYACAYAADGRRIISADKGQVIRIFASDENKILGIIDGFNYRIKRLIKASDEKLFAAGPDGMFELDIENYTVTKSFGAFMVSTKENGVLCKNHLYIGGYGYQLATYQYDTGELIDLEETQQDFTKAFTAFIPADGVPILLVGGRGGFMNIYRLLNGVPHKIREFYLN